MTASCGGVCDDIVVASLQQQCPPVQQLKMTCVSAVEVGEAHNGIT